MTVQEIINLIAFFDYCIKNEEYNDEHERERDILIRKKYLKILRDMY